MNRLIKHNIEEKIVEMIKVTGRRESRRNQLLDDPQETKVYYKLKEEAIDRILGRTRLGTGQGPVVRQTK
jgi:hypothetical protein